VEKENRSHVSRPLQTRRDWLFAVLGMGPAALVGYLIERRWVNVALGVYVLFLLGVIVKRFHEQRNGPR
jgi:hypothetical protein